MKSNRANLITVALVLLAIALGSTQVNPQCTGVQQQTATDPTGSGGGGGGGRPLI